MPEKSRLEKALTRRGIKGYSFLAGRTGHGAPVAQTVERGTENPCVGGSIPPGGTSSKERFSEAARRSPRFFCERLKYSAHRLNRRGEGVRGNGEVPPLRGLPARGEEEAVSAANVEEGRPRPSLKGRSHAACVGGSIPPGGTSSKERFSEAARRTPRFFCGRLKYSAHRLNRRGEGVRGNGEVPPLRGLPARGEEEAVSAANVEEGRPRPSLKGRSHAACVGGSIPPGGTSSKERFSEAARRSPRFFCGRLKYSAHRLNRRGEGVRGNGEVPPLRGLPARGEEEAVSAANVEEGRPRPSLKGRSHAACVGGSIPPGGTSSSP